MLYPNSGSWLSGAAFNIEVLRAAWNNGGACEHNGQTQTETDTDITSGTGCALTTKQVRVGGMATDVAGTPTFAQDTQILSQGLYKEPYTGVATLVRFTTFGCSQLDEETAHISTKARD